MASETTTFIEQQASDWIVKLETGAMLDGDEERFVDWISADEAHSLAFAQAEQTWQLMHQVTKESEEKEVVNNQNKVDSSFRPKLLPIAASFLILAFTVILGNSLWLSMTADYYTSTGTRAEYSLSDGSVITLNTGSAIDVSMTADSRHINVLKGEIYVAVAPDKERPFVVQAGNMRVTALGTEFLVHKKDNQDALVVVTEHSVRVENKSDKSHTLVLAVGESVVLDNDRQQLRDKTQVNYHQESAWLKGKYVFTNQTLDVVIEELSRYHKGKIIITDDSLKTLTLNGVLDLDEPLTSLNNLTYTLPIKIRNITPYLVLIEKE